MADEPRDESVTGPGASDTADAIDPRIATRREEVERQQRRHAARRLLLAIGMAVAVVAAVALSRSPVLDVDRVTVLGTAETSPELILETSDITVGEPMVHVDLDRARRAVADLPWIQEVRVRRDWPATVTIEVVERQAVAVVAGPRDATWVLVDAGGRLLAEVDGPGDHLRLRGLALDLALGEVIDDPAGLVGVAAAMPEPLSARIRAVLLVDRGEIELKAPNGVRVRLGTSDRLDEKFLAAHAVFEQVDPRCVQVIDVRVPTLPTVRRLTSCAELPPVEVVDLPPADGTSHEPSPELNPTTTDGVPSPAGPDPTTTVPVSAPPTSAPPPPPPTTAAPTTAAPPPAAPSTSDP